MRFFEINLFGVYVAPISVIMVVSWLVLLALRRIVVQLDLSLEVWHPALFEFAVYLIVLSSLVLLAAR
jgi:protein AaeX